MIQRPAHCRRRIQDISHSHNSDCRCCGSTESQTGNTHYRRWPGSNDAAGIHLGMPPYSCDRDPLGWALFAFLHRRDRALSIDNENINGWRIRMCWALYHRPAEGRWTLEEVKRMWWGNHWLLRCACLQMCPLRTVEYSWRRHRLISRFVSLWSLRCSWCDNPISHSIRGISIVSADCWTVRTLRFCICHFSMGDLSGIWVGQRFCPDP